MTFLAARGEPLANHLGARERGKNSLWAALPTDASPPLARPPSWLTPLEDHFELVERTVPEALLPLDPGAGLLQRFLP
jgi:hypothetical protein